jgi:uncharacterized membrane protein
MTTLGHAKTFGRGNEHGQGAGHRERGIFLASALEPNVGMLERWASALGGAALVTAGLKMRSLGGLAMAAVGGALVFRATTGHCELYHQLGIDTAEDNARGQAGIGYSHAGRRGVMVQKSVTVQRPVEEVYRYWREFENLSKFMTNVKSVTKESETKSHWVVKAPMGATVEWDAEVVSDVPSERIAWRSLPGADIANEGEVRFGKAPGDRGTEIHVRLSYQPPAGRVGEMVAWIMGEDPETQVEDDLNHFKQIFEAGEIATISGQPRGR